MKKRLTSGAAAALFILSLSSCRRHSVEPKTPDTLLAGMQWEDRTMFSSALNRRTKYRLVFPSALQAGKRVHVLYLLHGNGGSLDEWTRYSQIAVKIPTNYVLVMPQGGSSYFMNSASKPGDRYEDFIVNDLTEDVESRFPIARDRLDRAIVGDSMGGFAALVLAFKHPSMFTFAGALSPPVDYPERPFSLRRSGQWMAIRSIFGASGSATSNASDPFVLARTADPSHMPYLFLSAGDQESLLEPIQRFDSLLTQRQIAHEFHVLQGGHNWQQWNSGLAARRCPAQSTLASVIPFSYA